MPLVTNNLIVKNELPLVYADTNENRLISLYLDMVRKSVLGLIVEDPNIGVFGSKEFSSDARENGGDWPSLAHSMIGNKRMTNIQEVAKIVISDNIDGDFAETGVWRGGACIFMAAIARAYNLNKKVWVCDSFEGLPKPNDEYPQDSGDVHYTHKEHLGVSLEQVKKNFEKYDLLSDKIEFIKGFFSDTLPTAPIEKLSILRLDGDMYESTIVALRSLYDKVESGGFIIVDDFNLASCSKAITDFSVERDDDFYAKMIKIDGSAQYWRKD